MSTITSTDPRTTPAGPTPSPAFVPFAGGDQRTVFRGVDWHTYTQLSEATGEGQHVRLIYDGKDLEIMVTGHVHEYYKELLSTLVKAVTMGRDLDSVGCGETTWKTVIRGLEADLSYYFEPEKVRVARAALARQSTDPADYPRPDLAMEIDVSPPQIDRPAIYADLGVAEDLHHHALVDALGEQQGGSCVAGVMNANWADSGRVQQAARPTGIW